MTTLYGIKNCDTVKKARKWLDNKAIDYQFHDFRVDGLERAQLEEWVAELGWETLVNKRSTTWKQLDQATNRATAKALKQKAAQIGQIKELTEDPESGSLTIVVEV